MKQLLSCYVIRPICHLHSKNSLVWNCNYGTSVLKYSLTFALYKNALIFDPFDPQDQQFNNFE